VIAGCEKNVLLYYAFDLKISFFLKLDSVSPSVISSPGIFHVQFSTEPTCYSHQARRTKRARVISGDLEAGDCS